MLTDWFIDILYVLRRGCIAVYNWSRHPTVQSCKGLYIALLVDFIEAIQPLAEMHHEYRLYLKVCMSHCYVHQ